jgi:hypothetical protein
VRRVAPVGAITALLLAACAGSGAPASSTVAPTTERLATASPAATAAATADLAHPVGIIAIGHSNLTGEGTKGLFVENKAASWATGTLPSINSIYLRMVAALPESEGDVANTAKGGARSTVLVSQAKQALVAVAVPALAMITTVDNDQTCDAGNVGSVGANFAAALKVIHDASPSTKILYVGQLGRASATFIRALVAYDPKAKAGLTWDDACSPYDSGGELSQSGIDNLNKSSDIYEAEMTRVCATVPNCATDGGLRKAWIDKIEYFSPDYNHLNALGQAAEAEQMWPVVEQLLGL